jgi:PIN domain nuclease of toxin-antitoxin system
MKLLLDTHAWLWFHLGDLQQFVDVMESQV